jgi:hypothetical protein
VDSVSPLLKHIGVLHAIFNKDSNKLHKATDKLHKLLSALRWLIYNCAKLFSIEEACRLPIFICKPHAKSPAKLHADFTHCVQRYSWLATHLREQK